MSPHFWRLCREFSSDPGKCRLEREFAGAGSAGHSLARGLVWGIPLTAGKSEVVLSFIGLTPFLTLKRGFALNAEGIVLPGDKGVWLWDGQFAHGKPSVT